MVSELVHASVGTIMTQAEFEAVGLHVLNSQATGDLICASSATQLSRLGIGATNAILTVIGGIPTWQSTLNIGIASATSLATSAAIPLLLTNGQLVNISLTSQTIGATTLTIPNFASIVDTFAFLTLAQQLDNKTLNASVAKGVWTASGTWTIPAVTLGDTVTINGKTFDAGAGIATVLTTAEDAGFRVQSNYNGAYGVAIELYTNSASPVASDRIGTHYFYGKNSADVKYPYGMYACYIVNPTSGAATAKFNWGLSTGTGIDTLMALTNLGVLTLFGTGKINPISGVIGFSVVSTALTLGSLGSVIIPQSAANVTDALAGNVAGAIALDLTNTTERLYFRGASWFYIAKTGGLSLTQEERVDPIGHRFEVGDVVKLVVDKVNPDGSFHALPYYLPNYRQE